jgi:hypothetical protein
MVVLDWFVSDRMEREPLMTTYRRYRKIGLAGVTLVVLGATGAVGRAIIASADDDHPGFTPIQYSKGIDPAAAAASITATSPADALTDIVTRVSDPQITRAELRFVPETDSSAGGLTAFLTVRRGPAGPTAIEDVWKAELVAGAVRDILSAKGLPQLDNFEVDEQVPGGPTLPVDSGFGNVATGQLFDTSSFGDVQERIGNGLRAAGLKPLSVTVLTVLQAAPMVIAETDNLSAFVERATDPDFWQQMLGDYNNYEGYYFELRDSAGEPVVISAAAHRAGSSSSWTRPDLRSSSVIRSPLPTNAGLNGG